MRFINYQLINTALLTGVIFFVATSQASAASLVNVSDVLSTSRPSPSSPLSSNATIGDGTVSIFNNGSRFLASDSARLIRTSSAAIIGNALTVSSQSAGLTTVYFGNAVAGAAGQSGTDVLISPISAMHTITFTVINAIPTDGDIVLTFPTLTSGDADNDASPSATTFQFNNLVTGTGGRANIDVFDDASDISANITITETEPSAGNSGVLSLNVDSGTIAAGSVITIFLGCTTSTSSGCTAQNPLIINPTKSAAAGTADTWRLTITTEDSSDIELDTAKVRVGTIESVFVRAEVEPSITFTITGIANGQSLSALSGSCGADTTNAGNATTATEVDLGFLTNGAINLAAQRLRVSTNAATGYAITATSSGQFINPATGFWIAGANGDAALSANDTPAPAVITASGTPDFGISPCGARVNNTTWAGSSATAFGSGGKYSNPYNSAGNSYYAGLAAYTGGPISDDDTYVRYAGTISGTTPAGIYRNIFTYVATATF